ncbi:MAG: zinc ABC transporter substrate-binding protein [Motiliproteus sp.]|nr:zinc ABC transporter substrate-binding protein [Motiliproteus sp.]
MRLLFRLSLLLALLFSAGARAELNVLACEPEWGVLVEELAGDRVKVSSATLARQDPHHIQARPSLISKARRADLLVCTGAELEIGWLPLLLRKSGNGKIQPGQPGNLIVTEGVELLGKPERLDRSMGDVHTAGNPHIQMDPQLIAVVAEKLQQRLALLDPDNADFYGQKGAYFQTRWRQAAEGWKKRLQSLQGRQVIVHHNNWPYLARWLQLEQLATLEPKPGVAPTTAHLGKLLTASQKQLPDMILLADYQNDRAARWLSDKTGVPVVKLPLSVDLGGSLFELYGEVVERLLQAAR